MLKTALTIQPICRGWISRTYAKWLKVNWKNAKQMQRIVRGFNVRCAVAHRKIDAFLITLPQYADKIAAMVRGKAQRKRFAIMMAGVVHVKIIVPSVRVLQRIYRGRLGRRISFELRLLRDAAIEIQRHARGLAKRRWLAYVYWKRYERSCCIRIQAHVRGWVEREVMRRRAIKQYYINVTIPSIIKVQSEYRGYAQRKQLQIRKSRWYNSLLLQGAWRTYVARCIAKRKWQEFMRTIQDMNATKIQRLLRGYKDRKFTYFWKATEASRRLYGACIIMRAWIRFRDGKRFKKVKEAWEIERSAEMLLDLNEEK
jgi:hypothetical protein